MPVKLGGYVALTKPRIIELLLITTIPAMFAAQRQVPPIGLMIATLVGGTLAAGSANALNCVVDADIDAVMRRTRTRPLARHTVSTRGALIFGVLLGIAATAVLGLATTWQAAVLAVVAILFYVFVYSLWLKRTSTQNIVIGGAAGAVPVLVGWAAVRNDVSWSPVVLFVVMFLWTPPHFWALAIRYADDYRAANVPMLPAVKSAEDTVRKMVGYTVLMVAFTLVLIPVAHLGVIYIATAVLAGGLFLWSTADLGKNPTPQRSMRVFGFSITYVTLLFAAMTIDVLVRSGV